MEEADTQLHNWTDTKIVFYESTLISGARGSELKGMTGHVAFGVENKTYSWDNTGYAGSKEAHPSFTDYLKYNASYRTGTLYELNFGSPELNRAAGEEIMKGPRNSSRIPFFPGGYNMVTNNCGETMCRIVERLDLPENNAVAPWSHK